jgi:hypothetical protein
MAHQRLKKWTAIVMTVAIVATQVILPATAADGSTGGAARRGLWITEIYQNDVSREKAGAPYSKFNNASDQMEFVEVTNTADEDINFTQDAYGLWYEYPDSGDYVMKQLTVSALDGQGDVVIPAGESAVFWNQRTDLAGEAGQTYATEEQFRQDMQVPDNVKVYKVSGQNGFHENDRGFAIKDADGNVLSYYHYNTTTDQVTANGLAVHLSIPEAGSAMNVWQSKKLPSPGYAYTAQLNGQREAGAPAEQPSGLFITEIRPNDSDRSEAYGSGTNDLMECLELTNTTDAEINLNEEYELAYRVNAGSYKALPLYHLDPDTADAGSGENCTVPAHSTVVLWCYRAGHTLVQGKDYQTYPTEAEFRAAYSIPESVPVYIFIDQNGLNNTLRGFDLYQKESNGAKTLVSRYFWDGATDLKDNKSVELKVCADGPLMEVYRAQSATNMGVVADAQITFPADDQQAPVVKLFTDEVAQEVYGQVFEADQESLAVLENGLDYGESLHIPYYFAGSDTLPVTSAELVWKTDKMDGWQVFKSTSFSIYNKFYAFIENGYLQGASSVDYYVKFYNAYRSTQTEVQHVEIHNDSEKSDLQVNLSGTTGYAGGYAGKIRVSAKDYSGENAAPAITLDGQAVETAAAMDRGAYFVFDHTGVDSYFKNALTTGGDTAEDGTIIGTFSKCSTIPSNGRMAIAVDGSYFTYNGDGSASIDLTLRPGTYGSCWEADSEENNEDFVASDLKLVLRDGTEITPTSCVGTVVNTGATAALNCEDSIKIGDSAGQYIKVDMSFNIPAENVQADAQSAVLDTAELSEGSHTLSVTAGAQTKTIQFLVNNKATVQEQPASADLSVGLTLSGSGSNLQAQVAAVDGASSVSVRDAKRIKNFTVREGAGDSTSAAALKNGSGATVSENGQYPYQLVEIPVDGTEQTLRIQLTAEDSYNQEVQLYVLKGSVWELLEVSRSENGELAALCPVEGYAADGKVQVLIQARTTAYTPYTKADEFNSYAGGNAGWDGQTTTAANPYAAPESYDFSIAWYSDTQYYSEQYHQHYMDMTDWIIANKEALDIRYVFHTGDIADEFNEEYEFAFARSQQEKLEQAGIPTGVLGGNHDVAHGNMTYDLYWKYFGEKYYADNSYYGGSYRNNLGHYDIVDVDGQEILFISISWDIYTPETDWINSVLDANPGVPAIITTHGGINATAAESYTSRILQNDVCKNHPQVLAILNGHYHGSSLNFVKLTSDDGVEHTLYQICTDYQSAPEGGSGYIKMLYFDLANNKIYLNSYSPNNPATGAGDVNYYDDKALLEYPDEERWSDGHYQDSDIDVMVLPVEFDRSEKTLTVSGLSVTGIYSTELGRADSGQADNIALTGGQSGAACALMMDGNGKVIACSQVADIPGSGSGSGSSSDPTYAITSNSAVNGAVTVSPKSASKGSTVTITAAPGKGYELDVLTVTDANGNKLTLTDKGNGKYTFVMPASKVTVSAAFKQASASHVCPAEKYADVDTSRWYHEGVDYALENGMMNGTDINTFAPNAATTRGMIVTILYRLEKNPAVAGNCPFDDVKDGSWYEDAVTWAAANKIVGGYGNSKYGPDDPITREQMAAILYRYAEYKGYDVTGRADLTKFADSGAISAWAENALSWANANGLVQGNGDKLMPSGNAERCQVAAILMRFCETVAK